MISTLVFTTRPEHQDQRILFAHVKAHVTKPGRPHLETVWIFHLCTRTRAVLAAMSRSPLEARREWDRLVRKGWTRSCEADHTLLPQWAVDSGHRLVSDFMALGTPYPKTPDEAAGLVHTGL